MNHSFHYPVESPAARLTLAVRLRRPKWCAAALVYVLLLGFLADAPGQDDPLRPEGTLRTRWASQVPDVPLNEYPRPQFQRPDWTNLNGSWEYAILQADSGRPESWEGTIRVPFAVESQLSKVQRTVPADHALWYRRTFDRPSGSGRLFLNFEAVDHRAEVWVNGTRVGEHEGGYDAFQFDITGAVVPGPTQELLVKVTDPTDADSQPRGKQVRRPEGIWYTSVTGIWQTVWLEWVPEEFIADLRATPDVDASKVVVEVILAAPPGRTVAVEVRDENRLIASGSAEGVQAAEAHPSIARMELEIPEARLWSPDSPHLYNLNVALKGGDAVASYFGMRKIAVGKDESGFNCLFLNNEPLFQLGPLDQGWWPDGLYTAPTDEALKYDIEITKQLGFNMCRKHVKVELRRWYYWADRLGLLVWQDMPSGGKPGRGGQFIRDNQEDAAFSAGEKERYRRELLALIDQHRNHPSIVAWVPFNEGWGQHDTNDVLAWVKQRDPTRLVDGPSGWTDRGQGDMKDRHQYPGPGMFETMADRASVLGEFGGLGLPIADHLWWDKRNWGYQTFTSREEMQERYEQLILSLRPLVSRGLAAAIYTQTTDVEGEVNGLMTYDRQLVKLNAERVARLHKRLYEPTGRFDETVLLPTSEREPRSWRYSIETPAEGWQNADFDDSSWSQRPAGFGTPDTPGTVVRTEWNTGEIWVRQAFRLTQRPKGEVWLRIHHDEDAEVYLNGKRCPRLSGYTVDYQEIPLPEAAATALKEGENVMAIRCRQTGGGQYIDAGLLEVTERR
jgi:hypothetical protein